MFAALLEGFEELERRHVSRHEQHDDDDFAGNDTHGVVGPV